MKKLFFAVFSAFAALALLISIGAYRTQAKELTSQVKISQLQAEGDKISYHWEIDGGVEVGDTFKISMPEDVSFASKVFSSMKNASGEEIATGQVSEDGKTLTITFVKGGNKGASGNVSFWYKWDKENTTGKDQDRTLKVGSESVIVNVLELDQFQYYFQSRSTTQVELTIQHSSMLKKSGDLWEFQTGETLSQ